MSLAMWAQQKAASHEKLHRTGMIHTVCTHDSRDGCMAVDTCLQGAAEAGLACM